MSMPAKAHGSAAKATRNDYQPVRINLNIKTVSEANRASHEHWRKRHARAKEQRGMARAVCFCRGIGHLGTRPGPIVLSLTRIAPRAMDSDNLAGSLKHVRDGVADALGLDDGSKRLTWHYAQERGKPKEYAVRVEMTQEQTNP